MNAKEIQTQIKATQMALMDAKTTAETVRLMGQKNLLYLALQAVRQGGDALHHIELSLSDSALFDDDIDDNDVKDRIRQRIRFLIEKYNIPVERADE